jgi:spermidine synthase
VILLGACFLSGVAALIYEIVWTRRLTLVLGHTVEAVATVLAAFMGGLAIGGALAGRAGGWSPSRLRRSYAALEAGTAGLALLFPLLLRAAEAVAPARGLASAAVLLPPTVLMGATLPILTALWAPAGGRTGRAAGLLYASNTVGAVAGTLAAALLLIPFAGLQASTFAAVGMNLAAAALVLAMPPTITAPPPAHAGRAAREEAAGEAITPAAALAVAALSGLGALAAEVGWTRALVLLIGPTAYAFAFVVASVIAGLAVGSAMAAALSTRLRRPASALAAVELTAALVSVAVVRVVGELPETVGNLVRAYADQPAQLMAHELAFVFGLLLIPSFLFGAAFPLLVALVSRAAAPAAAVGRVYAANTAGAIAGSLLAGFVVLPRAGIERTLLAAASAHAAAGLVAWMAAGRSRGRWIAAIAAAGTFAAALALVPAWDPERLSGGAYKYAVYGGARPLAEELKAGDLVFYREGRTATVSVRRLGGVLSLAIDGKVDATSGADMPTQRLLAHVPLLLHPAPAEVCVIGLGSGATAGAALEHAVQRVDSVEISPEVVAASALFRGVNGDPLSDPRHRLVVGDGRNHLLRTRSRYDVIISEPSNPWMAGVSALFTRDFFRLARQRLAPGGLFCQWIHIYNMDPRDLRSVAGGFTDAFPQAGLFLINEGDVLLVGATGPFPELDLASLRVRLGRPQVAQDLAAIGVRGPFGFATLLALTTPALSSWAAEAPRHTDDRPLLEYRAPRFMHADTARENRSAIEAAATASPPPGSWHAATAAPTGRDLLDRATLLERSHSYLWAGEVYRAALERDRALEAYEGLVRCALESGRAAETEQDLRGLVEGDPVRARVGLALLHHALDREAEALAELQEASRREPRNARALLLAAEIQDGAGNVDALEALANLAAAAAPGDPEAESFVALARLRRGQPREAVQRAEAVLARAPATARALEVAAVGQAVLGEREAARRDFEALVSAEPDSWAHLNNYGVFELEGHDYHAAARLFERAVDIYPGNVQGYRGLLESARALGDDALAERAEQALARFKRL